MTKQLYGDELVLSILEKELVALTKKADKAKADCDASMNAGSAIIELRREAVGLMDDSVSAVKLKRLKELAAEEKRLFALARRDLVKLMDAEHQARFTRDELAQIIAGMSWRVRNGRR